MNNNLALLSKVEYPLHDPAHEVVRAMSQQRIEVRLKIPKAATEKARAKNVEFELMGSPSHVINPHEILEAQVKKAVDYFNGTRKAKQAVKAKGTKILILADEKAATKKAEDGNEGKPQA